MIPPLEIGRMWPRDFRWCPGRWLVSVYLRIGWEMLLSSCYVCISPSFRHCKSTFLLVFIGKFLLAFRWENNDNGIQKTQRKKARRPGLIITFPWRAQWRVWGEVLLLAPSAPHNLGFSEQNKWDLPCRPGSQCGSYIVTQGPYLVWWSAVAILKILDNFHRRLHVFLLHRAPQIMQPVLLSFPAHSLSLSGCCPSCDSPLAPLRPGLLLWSETQAGSWVRTG